MQSVNVPLLVEETHSSLSSLTILGEETENGHLADVPDNRRFIQPLHCTSHIVSTSPNASTKPTTKSLSKPSPLAGKSNSITATTTEDDDDDDVDPLLRDVVGRDSSMRKLPSTLFSPMSESCGSSLVEGSTSDSTLATPMEISRLAYSKAQSVLKMFLFELLLSYQ